MFNRNAPTIGIDGVYRCIIRFEDRQAARMSFLHGQVDAASDSFDDFI